MVAIPEDDETGELYEPDRHPPRQQSRHTLQQAQDLSLKAHNVILLLLGIVVTVTTVAPIAAIVEDTITDPPGHHRRPPHRPGRRLHAGQLHRPLHKQPGKDQPLDAADKHRAHVVGACVVSIIFGGLMAFLVTRTNLACRKYLSSIFIFPYIMPQWTLAVVWQNLFNSNAVTGTSNGLLAATLGIEMPAWWCVGLFPCVIVLGLHYAPFAYILIGGIFRNMDANLEEAATILDTPKWKIMFRVTLPMVKPAILSTILLVFGSAMGSYPVPHYLNFTTLSTKYVSMNSKYTGEASILAIIMMIFGVAIMLLNQLSLQSRKNYTTVTGKIRQISKVNLGKTGRVVIAIILIILTFFTSIFPIVSFAFETFLPNPGDYSFLYTGDASNLTTKWWLTNENITENGMYGQKGILYNEHDMAGLQGYDLGQRLLRAARRHHRHHDRLRRQQEPPEQVGELRQLHGLPAVPHAVHSGRRGVLRAVLKRVHEPVQHIYAAHHSGHHQVHTLRQPQRAQLHAAALG